MCNIDAFLMKVAVHDMPITVKLLITYETQSNLKTVSDY